MGLLYLYLYLFLLYYQEQPFNSVRGIIDVYHKIHRIIYIYSDKMQRVFECNGRIHMKLTLHFKQLNNTEEIKYKPIKR